MITNEIDVLRDKLDSQIIQKRPFNEIYSTSVKLDRLITEYYRTKGLTKKVQKV